MALKRTRLIITQYMTIVGYHDLGYLILIDAILHHDVVMIKSSHYMAMYDFNEVSNIIPMNQ